MKVRANSVYTYNPSTVLDRFCPTTLAVAALKPGSKVRVINLFGAPKCNTMGQCHIETLEGVFLGMVSTNSLTK